MDILTDIIRTTPKYQSMSKDQKYNSNPEVSVGSVKISFVDSVSLISHSLSSSLFAVEFVSLLMEHFPKPNYNSPETSQIGYTDIPYIPDHILNDILAISNPELRARCRLLIHATQEVIATIFADYSEYTNQNAVASILHSRNSVSFLKLKSNVVESTKKWAEYSETFGENLDALLIHEVREDEKVWRKPSKVLEEKEVMQECVDEIWEGLLQDTVLRVDEVVMRKKYKSIADF